MRKDRNLRTYGRHKNIVIVSDVWFPEGDKKSGHGVFSTSSDDSSRQVNIFQSSSSSENGALSLNSTGNSEHSLFKPCKKETRRTRKVNQTSNKENEHPQRQTRKQDSTKNSKEESKVQKHVFSLSSSSEHSIGSEKNYTTRALRDRNQKIDYNDSANVKKQLRGTEKRKRPVRTRNVSKSCKEPLNFSDFDNYSLFISDSPSLAALKSNKLLSVETSTPVAKRTRCKDVGEEKMKVTDISHIEMVDSPGAEASFPGADTPESAHSQSLFNTPSVLSSNCSEDISNWSRKHGESVNGLNRQSDGSSVKFHRLTESTIAAALAVNPRSGLHESKTSQMCTRSHRFNNSESLFSSPDGNVEKNISLLTERLQQVRCGQLYNDSIAEEVSSVSHNDNSDAERDENSDSEEDTDDSDEENKSKNDSNVSRNLSAIDEDEETSDGESDEEDEESDASYASENDSVMDSDEEQESGECERATRKNKKSNLQRLSESLLMNHVNRRRTKECVRKEQNCSEIDDIADCLKNSHIDSGDSNDTLYMLNDGSDRSKKSGSLNLSVHKEEDSDSGGEDSDNESKDESVSVYHTAPDSRYSDGGSHTSEDVHNEGDEGDDDDGGGDGGTDEEDEQIEEAPCTPARKQYSLRGQLQHLQNSFSELLSPKRKKSSLVPLSAQTRVLLLCNQSEAVTFRTALSREMISKCKKIGEGVYGEVFRSYNSDEEAVAIKIIPIEGDFEVNDEQQKKFPEILPEVVIANQLSNLRHGKGSKTSSFCQVNNASCVKGKYPLELVREWDVFHKNKGSENDRPDVFPTKQLYIVFEFADCGTALESYKFDTIQQAKSVLCQVAYALAVAEETLQFEHRDLHWGNVLVRPAEKEDIRYRLLGKPVSVPSHGVEASVIDFTMSRLTKDGCTVYINIPDDDTLFQGEGDYQFDIYREMKKENKGNWEKFCPHTNVLWLHYLADKLVYSSRYSDLAARQERKLLRQFRQFLSTMLQYRSACDMVVDSQFLNS